MASCAAQSYRNLELIIPANCNRGVNAAIGTWVKLIAGYDVLHEHCITNFMDYSCLHLSDAYKYIIAATIMYIAINQISISDNLWLTLIAKISFGAVIYVALLVIMRDTFLLQNTQLMINKIRKKVGK